MKTKKFWIPVLLVVLIAIGSGAWFYQKYLEKKEEPPIRVMYIPLGDDDHLMIGQNNGDVFSITMPDTILDENGKQITWQELKRGNLLDIYGDGIMLESYPGQYPGVTRIKVVSQGDPADADQYQDIIDEIWSPRDSSQLPCLNVGYTQSYGVISAVTMQGGYSWTYTDEEGVSQTITADSSKVTMWSDLPIMNIEKATDMELYFDEQPVEVTAIAYPADFLGTEASGEEGETASIETDEDGNFVLKNARGRNDLPHPRPMGKRLVRIRLYSRRQTKTAFLLILNEALEKHCTAFSQAIEVLGNIAYNKNALLRGNSWISS